MTKTFVSALTLQLVEEGVLELDGEAGPLAEGATTRQLLNHTAGFPNWEDDVIAMFEPYRQDPAYRSELGTRDVLALVKAKPRRFPPGEGWSYSGSNYLILGLIIEDATGASLADELRRRIFEPLELSDTELPPDSHAVAGMARGYLPPDNPLLPGSEPVDVTDLGLPFNPAGGGIVSTARDVGSVPRSAVRRPRGLRRPTRRAFPDRALRLARVRWLWPRNRASHVADGNRPPRPAGLRGAISAFRQAMERSRWRASRAIVSWSWSRTATS